MALLLARCTFATNLEPVDATGGGAAEKAGGSCEAACLARSDCTAVRDLFWLAEVRGCYLFSGDCCGTAPLPYGDTGQSYRKVCN